MGVFDALNETTSNATKKGKAYIQTTKKYYELKVFQQLVIISNSVLKIFIYSILSTLGLIFLAIGLASFLNTYYENNTIGYVIVAFVFFVLMAFAYLLRKFIEKFVIRALSKNYFD